MLHKRSIKEKLLKGGAWAFAGKVATAFTALAVNALLARLLVPEDIGAYFLILSLVSVTAIVAQLGLTQTIVRLVAESLATSRPARARLAVRLAVRLTALGALLMAGLLAFGGGAWLADHFFHSQIMSKVMGLAAVWVVINTFQQLIAEVYRGFHDIRLATIFGGLVTGLLAMLIFLGLWLLQGYSDLHQAILVTVIAGCSSITLSSLFLLNKLKALPASTDAQLSISDIMMISWPLWVSNLMLFATM
ncbi:MAG: oligosaccharide flippase family protein, partial [Mariprofundaceae bacterium]|nr:oligosaccharide flippase family protein [Mariprofundaceae bacterium]